MSDCTLPAALAQTLTRRETIIDTLLAHYNEAQETLHTGQGPDDANASGSMMMPPVWNDSYRELEATLRLIAAVPWKKHKKVAYQRLYWQLSHWYLRVERVQRFGKHEIELGRGKKAMREGPYIHVVRRPEVEAKLVPALVRQGVALVALLFDGEPFVPEEIHAPEHALAA